jgi:hypothetical protein
MLIFKERISKIITGNEIYVNDDIREIEIIKV